MSELHTFDGPAGPATVVLPFALDDLLADWKRLRRRLVRQLAVGYTRDEWAYLLAYTDPHALEGVFTQAFGARTASGAASTRVFRPRGTVAIWLPNNVSLLGPLSLLLISLTGARVRIKLGSRADDLVQPLLDLIRAEPDLPTLHASLADVVAERFSRTDPRNATMAADARIRIAFGSDEAMQSILSQPGRIDRRDIAFGDRQSVAWVEPSALDDASLDELIRVFALYGREGCTSPRRVVLVDGSATDVATTIARLQARWPQVSRDDVPVHVASQNRMVLQWGRALGVSTHPVDRQRAVLVDGPAPAGFGGTHMLEVVAERRADLVAALPANVQTIGHIVHEPSAPEWLGRLAASSAARFVPVRAMHHFGSVWDGQALFRELFDELEVGYR